VQLQTLNVSLNGGGRGCWPEANIGIVTGRRRFVVDVDNRDGKNGSATLDELCDRLHFQIPETSTVMTGGGGWQYHLETPRWCAHSEQRGKIGGWDWTSRVLAVSWSRHRRCTSQDGATRSPAMRRWPGPCIEIERNW
jgi:hypothetical protein